MKGEPLGVEEPEGAGLFRAVRGLLLLLVRRPPLSLHLSRPLLGSELGVDKRGVPDVLRCRGAGEDTLDCTFNSSIAVRHCNCTCRYCCVTRIGIAARSV